MNFVSKFLFTLLTLVLLTNQKAIAQTPQQSYIPTQTHAPSFCEDLLSTIDPETYYYTAYKIVGEQFLSSKYQQYLQKIIFNQYAYAKRYFWLQGHPEDQRIDSEAKLLWARDTELKTQANLHLSKILKHLGFEVEFYGDHPEANPYYGFIKKIEGVYKKIDQDPNYKLPEQNPADNKPPLEPDPIFSKAHEDFLNIREQGFEILNLDTLADPHLRIVKLPGSKLAQKVSDILDTHIIVSPAMDIALLHNKDLGSFSRDLISNVIQIQTLELVKFKNKDQKTLIHEIVHAYTEKRKRLQIESPYHITIHKLSGDDIHDSYKIYLSLDEIQARLKAESDSESAMNEAKEFNKIGIYFIKKAIKTLKDITPQDLTQILLFKQTHPKYFRVVITVLTNKYIFPFKIKKSSYVVAIDLPGRVPIEPAYVRAKSIEFLEKSLEFYKEQQRELQGAVTCLIFRHPKQINLPLTSRHPFCM